MAQLEEQFDLGQFLEACINLITPLETNVEDRIRNGLVEAHANPNWPELVDKLSELAHLGLDRSKVAQVLKEIGVRTREVEQRGANPHCPCVP